jgi:hypothetical protein
VDEAADNNDPALDPAASLAQLREENAALRAAVKATRF